MSHYTPGCVSKSQLTPSGDHPSTTLLYTGEDHHPLRHHPPLKENSACGWRRIVSITSLIIWIGPEIWGEQQGRPAFQLSAAIEERTGPRLGNPEL